MSSQKTPSSENKKKQQTQQQTKTWKDLPGFADVCSTVVATTFGARRLPELKSLWTHANNNNNNNKRTTNEKCKGTQQGGGGGLEKRTEDVLTSGGGKTSSRHLRRRTTSYSSRKHHRYPDALSAPSSKQPQQQQTVSRRGRRKRKSMLSAPHESWRHNSTSETTCIETSGGEKEDEHDDSNTVVDRAINETIEPLQSAATNADDNTTNENPLLNWIPTHIWHAKRFRMESLWGWRVPLMHSNRGARGALRLLREGKLLIQDVTWRSQPIGIEWKLPIDSCNEEHSTPTSNTATAEKYYVRMMKRVIPDFCTTRDIFCEGMFHGLNTYPRGSIGPVRWLVSNNPLAFCGGENVDVEQKKKGNSLLFVYLWLHPSIRPSALELLTKLLAAEESGGASIIAITDGLSCLRLYGHNILDCLNAALPSLSVHHPTSFLGEGDTSADINRTTMIGELLSKGHTVLCDLDVTENLTESSPTRIGLAPQRAKPTLSEEDALGENSNAIINQVDLLCSPDVSKSIFLALVLKGGSCPIGLVEEAHLLLESSPPGLVFPRDFPDTKEGRAYWSYDNGDSSRNNWDIVRWHLEGGGGRIPPKIKGRRMALSWPDLVTNPRENQTTQAADASSETEDHVVMVRGSFGKPFEDAISAAYKTVAKCVPDSSPSICKRQRRRRRTEDPQRHVCAPMLSKKEARAFSLYCQNLSSSLTLPAVLLCHFEFAGKGAAPPGTKLYSVATNTSTTNTSNDEDDEGLLVGFVTASAFSPARGRCHGLAVCGAARLLVALSNAPQDRSIVFAGRLTDARKACLKLIVGDDVASKTPHQEASLSLVF